MRAFSFLLVCVIACLLGPRAQARAQALRPRVVVTDSTTSVEGLPAVSGDGRTVVVGSETWSRDGTASLGVSFYDVGSGRYVDGWQVFSRDEDGAFVALADLGHGETPWRRARNLTLALAAQGYVPLTELVPDDPEAYPPSAWSGAALRLRVTGTRVELRDDGGTLRTRRTLPVMRAYCGMSDDAPHDEVPIVLAAYADDARGVLLLRYGIVYASCMCDDDVVTRPFRVPARRARGAQATE